MDFSDIISQSVAHHSTWFHKDWRFLDYTSITLTTVGLSYKGHYSTPFQRRRSRWKKMCVAWAAAVCERVHRMHSMSCVLSPFLQAVDPQLPKISWWIGNVQDRQTLVVTNFGLSLSRKVEKVSVELQSSMKRTLYHWPNETPLPSQLAIADKTIATVRYSITTLLGTQ